VTQDFSAGAAGFITGTAIWPALIVSPLVGLLIDRFRCQRLLIMLAGPMGALLVALLPWTTGWAFVLMLLLGIVQSFIPASIMSLAPEVVRPERLGVGYGVITTCLNLGIIIGPALVGVMRDASGSFTTSYLVMAAFSLLIPLVLLPLRTGVNKRVG